MFIELRDEIENHCNKCVDQNSQKCSSCFFASLDFGKINLGSNYAYRRAYHYLQCLSSFGYIRENNFGTHLNISRKACMV